MRFFFNYFSNSIRFQNLDRKREQLNIWYESLTKVERDNDKKSKAVHLVLEMWNKVFDHQKNVCMKKIITSIKLTKMVMTLLKQKLR